MTDELTVTGIECRAHHGVFDFEKRDGQVFVVDLTLGLDTRPAAASDDLQDTVDYGSLVAAVKAAVERDPADLVETVIPVAGTNQRQAMDPHPMFEDQVDGSQDVVEQWFFFG